jgi:DNA polymerase
VAPRRSLTTLRADASGCRACALWQHATQTVFGEGPLDAEILLVGEQPGDREDVQGRPFVGPAGRLLDTALEGAGIDRERVYLTNAVKHFKWRPGAGKRRIHDKPSWGEINACLPCLHAELELVAPRVVVALGATAVQALLGRDFRVSREGGRLLTSPAGLQVVATIHPSAVLRARDAESRRDQLAALSGALAVAASAAAIATRSASSRP